MLRVMLALLILCIMSFSVSSSDITSSTNNDDDILEKISKVLAIKEETQGQFKQLKYIHLLPQPLESTGQFSFNKKNGLLWSTIKPIKSEMIFDENGVRQQQGSVVLWQADKNEPGIKHLGEVIKAILSANWLALDPHFIVTGFIDGDVWKLTLSPRDAALQKNIIKISLNGAEYIHSMVIFEDDNNRTDISFTITTP